MRLKNLKESPGDPGNVMLNWDTPISPVSYYIEDWLESLLHTLKIECTCPERAATYFYHRQYSTIATKRAMAMTHPEMCNDVKPEEFDELIRMLFNELPHLYNNLK